MKTATASGCVVVTPRMFPIKQLCVYICTINTDTNYVICCSHVTASAFTQGNIFAAVAIKSECTITDSRVRIAATVVSQSAGTEAALPPLVVLPESAVVPSAVLAFFTRQ